MSLFVPAVSPSTVNPSFIRSSSKSARLFASRSRSKRAQTTSVCSKGSARLSGVATLNDSATDLPRLPDRSLTLAISE